MKEGEALKRIVVEGAPRQELFSFFSLVVAESPFAFELLDLSKGQSLTGATALLLSNASAQAKRSIGEVLTDLSMTYADNYFDAQADAAMQSMTRVLDLVEIALVEAVPLPFERLIGTLRKLCAVQNADLFEAVARVLSYFRTSVALTVLSELSERHPDNQTVAAHLLNLSALLDPLTSLDRSINHFDTASGEISPELVSAIQSAIWAMFEIDGRLAKAKLVKLSATWTPKFIATALAVLEDKPLNVNLWAREAVREISRSLASTKEDALVRHPSGIARRVLEEKKQLDFLGGYSLSAATDTSIFRSYKSEWMTALANEICRILALHYPESPVVTPNFLKWPENFRWSDIFGMLLLRTGQGDEHRHTADLCCEIVYMDELRINDYKVVEFGRLTTFSVVYLKENKPIASYFRDEIGSNPKADRSCVKALATWKRDSGGPQTIFTPLDNVAGDLIRQYTRSGHWEPHYHRVYDRVNKLFEEMQGSPQTIVVICDNVSANDLVARGRAVELNLETNRIEYPTPMSVGLAFDSHEPDWGDILGEALTGVVVDKRPDVRKSLAALIEELLDIDVRPTGVLARAFGRDAAVADAVAVPVTEIEK